MTCALPRLLCPHLHHSPLHRKPLKLHVTDHRLAQSAGGRMAMPPRAPTVRRRRRQSPRLSERTAPLPHHLSGFGRDLKCNSKFCTKLVTGAIAGNARRGSLQGAINKS